MGPPHQPPPHAADAGPGPALSAGLTFPQGDAPTRPRALPPISLAAGIVPRSQDVFRELLQKRLREIAVVTVVAWSGLIALFSTSIDGLLNVEVVGWKCVALMGLPVAVAAGCRASLTARRALSVGWLRGHEALIFGTSTVTLVWLRGATLDTALDLVAAGEADGFAVSYATAFNNLCWMTLIIIYGVFVPNTWRQTVKVVVGMALLPCAVDALAWAAHPALLNERLLSGAILTLLTLFVSLSTSIFGAFKISTLEEDAAAARRQAQDLGQYHLVRKLGEGGMGEVYLAEHRLLKRPCAVKLIRPERAGDPNTLARFAREVRATARLRHPNTVAVFDYGQGEDGTFYYVMEYLDGLDLETLVRLHGPLPPERAAHLARQLSGALREAHRQGLVHRDIKPGNVFVCRHGGLHDVAKLLDFGLVVQPAGGADSRLTRVGYVVGTPEYMAPEQAVAADDVDGRSDLYSLGALLYYTLTGQPPFVGPTALDVLLAHRDKPVRPLWELRLGVPADLEAVVTRCLAKDRTQRFPDADSLTRALEQCRVGPWGEEQAAAWWHTHVPDAPAAGEPPGAAAGHETDAGRLPTSS